MAESIAENRDNNSDGRARSLANLEGHKFQKGQSGNPGGRPRSKILSEAYRRELERVDESDEHKRTNAELIAVNMVKAAKDTDFVAAKAAARELADRTEGKAKQTVTLSFERRERLEAGIQHIITEASCSREEAIVTLAQFEPDAMALLNTN